MIEHYMRPHYQSLIVDPVIKYFSALAPNIITLCACVIGISVAPALVFIAPWIAALLLLISGYLDTVDGTVARLQSKVSASGTVFDIVSDRIVEASVILGLYAVAPDQRGWYTLFMLGSCYICVTSFLVVGIFVPNESNKGFYYSPGLMERAEAFILFIAMMLLPTYFNVFSLSFSILVLLTSFIRVKEFFLLQKNTRLV